MGLLRRIVCGICAQARQLAERQVARSVAWTPGTKARLRQSGFVMVGRRRMPLAKPFRPQDLFRLSEPGVHFEAYDPNTLLQRRNFAFASEDLTITTTNQGWNKTNLNAGITTGVNSYDGQPIAQTVTENTAAGQHVYFGNATWLQNDGTDLVFEGEFKYAGRQVKVFVTNSSFTNSFFTVADLQAGTLSGTGVGGSGASVTSTSITALANGYYRVRIRGKLAITDTTARVAVYLANGAGADNYTGDGVSGVTATRHIFARGRDYDTNPAYQKVTDWNTEYMAAALESIGMWQDSSGNVPVTAVEQTCGLWLDKRLGATWPRAADVVTPASAFVAGGAAYWSGSGTFSYNAPDATVSYVENQTSYAGMVTGEWFEITFTQTYTSGTAPSIVVKGTTVTLPNSSGARHYILPAGSSVAGYGLRFSTFAAGVGSISNITMRKVMGSVNHATQATAGSRPVLSARYNQLTKTEQFDDAAWNKVGSPIITANTGAAPGGAVADLLTRTTTAATHLGLGVTKATTSIAYRGRIWVKKSVGNFFGLRLQGTYPARADVVFNINNGTISSAATGVSGFTNVSATITAADGGYWVTLDTTTDTANILTMYVGFNSNGGWVDAVDSASDSAGYLWGADVRTINDAALDQPAYQRVNTSTDYDTAGFIHYLKFDGTDDSLVTSTVDFSGSDKVTVWAGITKLSDAAAAIVCELGTSAAAGEFGLLAPTSAAPSLGFRTIGSSADGNVANISNAAHAAPITAIVTGNGVIADDVRVLRINGVQVATNSADQGAGNLQNAAVYIGRRNQATLPFNGRITSLSARGGAHPAERFVREMNQYAAKLAGQFNVFA